MTATADRRGPLRPSDLFWPVLPLALLAGSVLLLWPSLSAGWWRGVQQYLLLRFLVLGRWLDTVLLPVLEQVALIFLGLFFEALPFLLLGALVSGLLSAAPSLGRRLARRASGRPALLLAPLGGFLLPVCECGVVPVARRLWQLGTPLPVAAGFLLAGPVLNPIGVGSTSFAFAHQPAIAIWRFGLTFAVALAVGLLLRRWRLVRPVTDSEASATIDEQPPPGAATAWRTGLLRTSEHAYADFLNLAPFFIAGTLVAALVQTLVPQSTVTGFAGGPSLAVVAMMGLAVVLSVCSTVDAFIALGFSAMFPPGAVVAFLVFGAMVDLKSVLLYSSTFPRPVVLALVGSAAGLCLLGGMLVNVLAGAGL